VPRPRFAEPSGGASGRLRPVGSALFVLLNSDSPAQVIDKLQRLGRFIHSRHRTEVVASQPDRLILDHVSTVDEPPRVSEDLAAFGQHPALLDEIGCEGLRARFPKGPEPERWVVREGRCDPLDPDGDCSRWELTRDALVPTRRPMPGLDEQLLASVDEPALREAPRGAAGQRSSPAFPGSAG